MDAGGIGGIGFGKQFAARYGEVGGVGFGQKQGGVGKVSIVGNAFEGGAGKEQFPGKHRVGGTQGQLIGSEMLQIGLHGCHIEDGVGAAAIGGVAGVVEHEGAIVDRWRSGAQLVQADGGR